MLEIIFGKAKLLNAYSALLTVDISYIPGALGAKI
jgi:uncharacterized membrane protein